MIQGIIFDMDGTLVDTEPLWQEAEIAMFETEGLHLTVEDCTKTMGVPAPDAMKYWHSKIKDPSKTPEEFTDEIIERVIVLMKQKAVLNNGVIELLDFLRTKKIPMAIASSSTSRIINLIVGKFNLGKYFDELVTGDHEPYGKPHPGIYLTTAGRLKADPLYCVAFEDSLNGMISAKAAKLKVVAYLGNGNFGDTKYDFTDLKLESFYNFGASEYAYLQSLM